MLKLIDFGNILWYNNTYKYRVYRKLLLKAHNLRFEEVLNMTEPKAKQEKLPFYKKVIGVGIMAVVATYCFQELQERMVSVLDSLKNEWRKNK